MHWTLRLLGVALVAMVPIDVAVGREVLVRVVGAVDPAQADLRYLSADDFFAHGRTSTDPGPLDWREVVAEHGRPVELDPKGHARIPDLDGHGFVTVRQGELWGSARLPASSSRVDVLLRTDRSVFLRVIGRDGRPRTGVPLQLLSRPASDYEERDQDEVFDFVIRPRPVLRWSGRTTSADGRVVLPHVQEYFDSLDGDTALYVKIDALLHEDVTARLLPDTEELVLQLPPTGSVVLWLPEDVPVEKESPASATLTLRDSDVGEPGFPHLARGRRTRATERFDGRKVRFDHVALGHLFEAHGTWSDGTMVEVVKVFPGPARAGDAVQILLDPGPDRLRAVGRLLGVDGEPLRSTRVECDTRVHHPGLSGSRSSGYDLYVTTNEDGRFEIDLDHALPSGAIRIFEFTQRTDSGQTLSRVRYGLIHNLQSGDSDLGDLRLVPRRLLAECRVVDESGAPVTDARVQVLHDESDFPWAGEYAWDELQDVRAEPNPDGTLRLTGWEQAAKLGLRAKREGHLDGPVVSFAPGSTDLVVPLGPRTAILEGNLLLDPEVPLELIQIQVRTGPRSPATTDGTTRWEGSRIRRLEDSPTFRVEGLIPGRNEVQLRIAGADASLLEYPDVRAEAGTITRDPSLIDLDLRGRLQVLRLEVVDDRGRPLLDATAHVSCPRDGVLERSSFTLHDQLTSDERLTIIAWNEPLEIEVSLDGYRTARLTNVREDRRVVLLPELAVELTLDWPASPLPEDVVLQATAHRPAEQPDSPPLLGDWDEFNAHDRLELRFPEPGDWRIVFSARRASTGEHLHPNLEDWHRMIYGGDSDHTLLSVQDAQGLQRIAITPPSSFVEQLLAALAD